MRVLVVLLIVLSGCSAIDPNATPEPEAELPAPVLDYVPINEDVLSEPTHVVDIIGNTYVTSVGEIALFVEWFLPDGDGPWPTILHSTPYSHLDRPLGGSGYIDYYVARGYAVAIADVRGFGESEGCVTIWGPDEQQDQAILVEWLAQQDWSDGNVGMVGVSYPGTTPIEAAVMAPPSLKAVIAVAGLTDPYFDWHFGGVPNGESDGSAAAYFGIGGVVPQNAAGGPTWATATAGGKCTDAPVITESYRMDGLYTQFYDDRNFSARAGDITAPVLYSQGFSDGNVKPSQALNFFNAIPGEKKGFFGQWAHSNPARDDWKVFEQAWFDEHLKGIDTGIMDGPIVEVIDQRGLWRADTHWPPVGLDNTELYLTTDGQLTLDAAEAGEIDLQAMSHMFDEGETSLSFESAPLPHDIVLSGTPTLRFNASIDKDNAFWDAAFYDDDARISFGKLNSALRDAYTEYKAMPRSEVELEMPFQPREWIIEEGSVVRLTLSLDSALDGPNTEAQEQVHATIYTGTSALVMPTLDNPTYIDAPWESE